jgi:REP element-mobilizing transposase RayT
MKRLYHFCITCHDEVLFRDDEDIRNITNILALECFACQVELWADAVMSTHLHGIAFAEEERMIQCCRRLKMRITKYHRNRHLGSGPLFDAGFFLLPLDGNNHILAAISYVLRNGLHHGQSATPFSYQHCSANHLFRRDLGKEPLVAAISSRAEIARYLPRRSEFPDYFAMDHTGMLLRSSFENLAMVEHYFRTPRCFDYYMSRLSGEEWQREQQQDPVADKPVTLSLLEPVSEHEPLARMLASEKGYNYSASRLSDQDLCRMIDTEYVPSHKRVSVYQLTREQRARIGDDLVRGLHISPVQARRCLAL